jgi:hypothetical protein
MTHDPPSLWSHLTPSRADIRGARQKIYLPEGICKGPEPPSDPQGHFQPPPKGTTGNQAPQTPPPSTASTRQEAREEARQGAREGTDMSVRLEDFREDSGPIPATTPPPPPANGLPHGPTRSALHALPGSASTHGSTPSPRPGDAGLPAEDLRPRRGAARAGGRLAAGGWRLAAGGWRLAAGGWLCQFPREPSRSASEVVPGRAS